MLVLISLSALLISFFISRMLEQSTRVAQRTHDNTNVVDTECGSERTPVVVPLVPAMKRPRVALEYTHTVHKPQEDISEDEGDLDPIVLSHRWAFTGFFLVLSRRTKSFSFRCMCPFGQGAGASLKTDGVGKKDGGSDLGRLSHRAHDSGAQPGVKTKIPKAKKSDNDVHQRPCKNVVKPDAPLFAASCCLSLLRASISCKPALCLGRDFLDPIGGSGSGLARGWGVG